MTSDIIRFPIIGDWGGFDPPLVPNGYLPTQLYGAKKYGKNFGIFLG